MEDNVAIKELNLISRVSGITGSKADTIHLSFYLSQFNAN